MDKISKVILFVFLAQLAHGQTDGKLLSRQPVIFPEYSQIQGIDWYYPKDVYDNAVHDPSVTYEKLTYRSDGLDVIAYLAAPADIQNKELPVIVFNRGSYIRNDIAFVHAPLFQKLVQNGFIVIAPALRESEGGGGKDELGGREVKDILNVKPLMEQLSGIDTKTIFLLGESRGGVMSYLALKNDFQARAVATIGAITDFELYSIDNPGSEEGIKHIIPNYEANKEAEIQNRSVMHWTEAINTPLFILQGGADPQVKAHHSLNLASELSRQGKPYRLMIFEGGNHILSGKDTEERDYQIINWFKKHID